MAMDSFERTHSEDLFEPHFEPLSVKKCSTVILNATTGETKEIPWEKTQITHEQEKEALKALLEVEEEKGAIPAEEKLGRTAFKLLKKPYIENPDEKEKLFDDDPKFYDEFAEKYWIADSAYDRLMGGLAYETIPPAFLVFHGMRYSKWAPVFYGGLTAVAAALTYYFGIYLPNRIKEEEYERRIGPLVDAFTQQGDSKENARVRAIDFNSKHISWAPYNTTTVDFAKGQWKTNPEFASLLLNATKTLEKTNALFYGLNSTNPDFTKWLFDNNPYFYGYLNDSNLDGYENSVLQKAAELGNLAPYLIRMPEVYTKEANLTDVLKYADLVKAIKAKDVGAAQFVLENGPLRILPLVDTFTGMGESPKEASIDAISFDGSYNLWKPYNNTAIDFAKGPWKANPEFASLLLNATKTLEKTNALFYGLNSTNPDFVKWLFDKNPHILDNVLADGMISPEEVKALTYLSTFDDLTQRERIEHGLSEASLKQLAILSQCPDQQFAQYAVKQKLGIEDYLLNQDEINLLTNPSSENIVKVRDWYLKLLEDTGDPTYAELVKEWKKLPEFKNDLTTVETTEDTISLALRGKPYAKFEDRFNSTAITPENEVHEAFELMLKGGTPDSNDFKYQVPAWNTELEVLRWLAGQNEFKKHDTLAQSIAMNHGLWVTMGDDQVRAAVYKDTNDLLNFFRETNEIQKARGYYQLEDYPLEAKVALTWRGNDAGTHGPYALSGLQPLGLAGTRRNYNSNRVDLKGYNWNNVNVDTLRSMRDYANEKGWIFKDIDTIVKNLEEYFSFSGFNAHWKYVSSLDEKIKIDGEVVSARNINNAGFLYNYYLEHGYGIGVCEDRMALTDAFLKSWGIPSLPILTYWNEGSQSSGHTHVIYYNPLSNLWKSYQKQLTLDADKSPIDFYIFKPPINQPGYVPNTLDGIVQPPPNTTVQPSYSSGEVNRSMFYPFLNTTQQNKITMFTTGIGSEQMKKWIIYSIL